MCNRPVDELPRQWAGKRTKASLILLVSAVVIVLLDIIGPIFLSGGHDVIDSRLHDQLAVLAVLSVPVILILLAIGAVLGMGEWYAARKASRRPSPITVVAACLNLALLLIGVLIVGYFLWTFEPYVASRVGEPRGDAFAACSRHVARHAASDPLASVELDRFNMDITSWRNSR